MVTLSINEIIKYREEDIKNTTNPYIKEIKEIQLQRLKERFNIK